MRPPQICVSDREAGQRAHHARQQQHGNANQAWAQGQNHIQQNHERFVQQGIQGNHYYRNTETGSVVELPFAGSPGIYQQNGDTWTSQRMGDFRQVGRDGELQEMESYEPGDYSDD